MVINSLIRWSLVLALWPKHNCPTAISFKMMLTHSEGTSKRLGYSTLVLMYASDRECHSTWVLYQFTHVKHSMCMG